MHYGRVSREIARGLKVLRKRIDDAAIPPSKLDESINVATWNIREFGRRRRRKAALHYIAEILGQFDLIAVTEVRDNLTELRKVLDYLGPYWRAVYSDFNTDPAGNRERIAYIYDKRAVAFTGLAAEADPPRKRNKTLGEYLPAITWWRSPYIVSFRAGNFDFILVTAHIRWDTTGGPASRARALKTLATWIDLRRREKHVADKDIIVMGDFNIPKTNDALFKAVTSAGLRVPAPLRDIHTNLAKNKRYDQILHFPTYTKSFTNHGGVLDFYRNNHKPLFRDLDKTAFTYQMSDHLPLWVQINTDTASEKLDQILNRG